MAGTRRTGHWISGPENRRSERLAASAEGAQVSRMIRFLFFIPFPARDFRGALLLMPSFFHFD
jgi:hypothetical protein